MEPLRLLRRHRTATHAFAWVRAHCRSPAAALSVSTYPRSPLVITSINTGVSSRVTVCYAEEINFRPLPVMRYFCMRLPGVSGMVNSKYPSANSFFKDLRSDPDLFSRPIISAISAVDRAVSDRALRIPMSLSDWPPTGPRLAPDWPPTGPRLAPDWPSNLPSVLDKRNFFPLPVMLYFCMRLLGFSGIVSFKYPLFIRPFRDLRSDPDLFSRPIISAISAVDRAVSDRSLRIPMSLSDWPPTGPRLAPDWPPTGPRLLLRW